MSEAHSSTVQEWRRGRIQGLRRGKILAFKHQWGKRFKSLFGHCPRFLPPYAAITMFPMGVCVWTLEPRNLCPLWPPLPIHAAAHWRQTVMDSRSDSVESVFSKRHRLWGLRWRPARWSLLPPGEWRAGTTITPGPGTPLGVRWKRNLSANTCEGAAVMTEAIMQQAQDVSCELGSPNNNKGIQK